MVGDNNVQNNYFTLHFPDPMEAAAQRLGRLVLAQWQEEAALRGLYDPVPIPVTWRASPGAYGDHLHLSGSAEGSAADLGAFARAFMELRQQRLVVLGGAGSGKTTLAVLLVIELLRTTQQGNAVPVLLSLASWQPRTEHLATWLERQLCREYPFLDTATARTLVSAQRILPVLDGLDELPAASRPEALRALNSVLGAGGSLVLTCRTGEYVEAVVSAAVLRGAAAVQAEPLTAAAIADHLLEASTPQHAHRWTPLTAELTQDPGGPLARALSVPLLLWLCRVVHQDPLTRPADLVDRRRFPTFDAVERHLLDALIPAVYPSGPQAPSQPGRKAPPRWSSDQAQRCLSTLAARVSRTGSQDIAWWQLHAPSRRLVKAGVASLPLWLVAVLWYPTVSLDSMDGEAYGSTLIIFMGCIGLGFIVPRLQPDAPGAVRLRSNVGSLLAKSILPMGWIMVLISGLSVASFTQRAAGGAASVIALVVATLAALIDLLMVTWLMVGAAARVDPDEASTPRSSLALSRRRTLTAAGALAFMVAPFVALPVVADAVAGHLPYQSPPIAPALRLAGFAAAVTVVLALVASPWAGYLATRTSLAARRRLPWHLAGFLSDAHRRGVLRQVGSVYQFRHAKLRDRLAERHDAVESGVPG
ncbi:NACHT domain-containing protein [Streptomyces sp. NPDC007074]|uniref:NACHT domain-containing protein n=1 Tax=Streptomyces sp. NPDC007074 TaxID=3156764 RepID=UPI0033F48C3A